MKMTQNKNLAQIAIEAIKKRTSTEPIFKKQVEKANLFYSQNDIIERAEAILKK